MSQIICGLSSLICTTRKLTFAQLASTNLLTSTNLISPYTKMYDSTNCSLALLVCDWTWETAWCCCITVSLLPLNFWSWRRFVFLKFFLPDKLLYLGYKRQTDWPSWIKLFVLPCCGLHVFKNFIQSDATDFCTHRFVLVLNSAWILSSFCLHEFTSSDLGSSYSLRRVVIPESTRFIFRVVFPVEQRAISKKAMGKFLTPHCFVHLGKCLLVIFQPHAFS